MDKRALLEDRLNRYIASMGDGQQMGTPDFSPEEYESLPEELKQMLTTAPSVERPDDSQKYMNLKRMLGRK